jgi:single-stranded-DNA-specific exonuclease
MVNSTQRWLVSRTNPEYVSYIAGAASVSAPFAQVLINRGLKDPSRISSFLDPAVSGLSDPYDLPGMDKAVARIRAAAQRSQRVLVHGDYDADGVTATSIMVEGLRRLGIDTCYFIPNRMDHGYGFGEVGVQKAAETGAHLIVTVDCGITSFEAVTSANSLGIDVIITDHHEPALKQKPENGSLDSAIFSLPEAVAVLNPKLRPSLTTAADLSGAGVALKLMQGLLGGNADNVAGFFDLAAIGTAADVVTVLDDNRIILREGIGLLRSGVRPGIRALREAAGMRPDFLRMSSLYYTLIPRLNAAGRMEDATDVVKLLTTDSEGEAGELALWLNRLNTRRQEVELRVYNEALEMAKTMDPSAGAIVLASEGWHPGVVGIVASRVAEEYNRPAFVLSLKDGVASGSARSIPAFDIHRGLSRCGELLRRFGGHKQAAGLSLNACNLAAFGHMISEVVMETLSEDDFVPVLNIDAAVSLSDITVELINEITRLEPFGYGNEEPVFGARGLEALQPRIVGNNHLKMYLRQNAYRIDSIGFDLGGMLPGIEGNGPVDAAFYPTINEWNGGRCVQLNIKALRPGR